MPPFVFDISGRLFNKIGKEPLSPSTPSSKVIAKIIA